MVCGLWLVTKKISDPRFWTNMNPPKVLMVEILGYSIREQHLRSSYTGLIGESCTVYGITLYCHFFWLGWAFNRPTVGLFKFASEVLCNNPPLPGIPDHALPVLNHDRPDRNTKPAKSREGVKALMGIIKNYRIE